MSYLARLKALIGEKRLPEEPTKLTEGAFVGSVSDQGSRFFPSEADADAMEERAGLAVDRVPAAYPVSNLHPVIEALRALPCPNDVSPQRFERLRAAALRFALEWSSEAVRLGWAADELFALAEPFANRALQGAAWFIGDATVTEINAATITLRTASGALQRIYRQSLQ